ncbi:MAG: HlyD family efflux transporter periplasmic adaptor subunit [Desulfitobacterium sp.]|nr:HlyD family efflux transporter periplasmic adaptor subunit [Desulfitobacterium sp.]
MSIPTPNQKEPLGRVFSKKSDLKRKFTSKKVLLIGAIVIIFLASTLYSTFRPLSGNVLAVQPSSFTISFTEEGQILPAQEWPLYNEVAGKITSLHVQNGDQVKEGQFLMELDTTDLQYQLKSLEAQLKSIEGQRLQTQQEPYTALIKQQTLLIEQAEKSKEFFAENLERLTALYEAGAISLADYEEAQLEAYNAESFLEQQKAALELLYEQSEPPQGTSQFFVGQKEALQVQINQLKEMISKGTITAPATGMIKDCLFKEGEYSAIGQPLLTVYEMDSYKIETFIPASEAAAIKTGDHVLIQQNRPQGKEEFNGEVLRVEPSAVEIISPLGLKEKRIKVTISFTSDIPVIIGSNADIQFTTYEAEEKLQVPKNTLFPYEEGDGLWVVREGKAQIQPVVKGMENQRDVIIEEGISPGDLILLDKDLPGLKEGRRIKSK